MRRAGMSELMFFDTYAFFEIIRGNPKYSKYDNESAITTIFNIAEFNFALKREFDIQTAENYTDKYSQFIIDIDIEDIKKAMTLRIKYRKLSMPDAIGYTIAQKYNIKFLTGDEEFKNFPNVEFGKK